MSIKKNISVFFKLSAFFVFCIASTNSLSQTKLLYPFSEKTFTLLAPEKNNDNIWRIRIQKKNPLTLGSPDKITALGFARLNGAPFSLDIRQPPKEIKALNFNEKKTDNIVLILKSSSLKKVMGSQLIIEKLFLIDIKNNKIIWQKNINEYSRTYGGFKTVSLEFISPDKTKYQTQTKINLNRLFIKAVQTSMPSTDMQAYLPGAPLSIYYAFHKNTYKKLSYKESHFNY